VAGVFETIRVREGRIAFLEHHLSRLGNTCRALGLEPPREGLAERLLRQVRAGDMVLRVTLEDGGERIEARPAPATGPMRIVFSGTKHRPYPHKTTDRKVFDEARGRVVPYRADEAILFTEDGLLAEGCITSVFFWLGSTLCTPSLDLGILPGVGRARVLELAQARGVPVQEGRYSRAEMQGLPLFLVNSVRGIMETTLHGDWRSPKGDDRTRLLGEEFWPVEARAGRY